LFLFQRFSVLGYRAKAQKNAVRLVLACAFAELDFAIGARTIQIDRMHAANAEFSRQVGAIALPGRGISRIPPC